MVKGLPPQIQDLDDFTESINILCHGDTGAGKTVLWAQLPRMLILALEEGTVSAKRRGSTAKVWRCPTWQEFVKAREWVGDNPDAFEFVLIDSVTKAQQLCIKRIMQLVVEQNPKRDPHIPAQGEHFKWQLMMKEMVSDWNELPVNVIWLARSMNKEDPEGEDIVVPLIEGKDYQISAWVCGEMHLLCYLKKERKKDGSIDRVLYTNDHPTFWSKDRYDCLPPVIKNPDANKIIKLIRQSEGQQRQEAAAKKPVAKKTARTRRK